MSEAVKAEACALLDEIIMIFADLYGCGAVKCERGIERAERIKELLNE